MCMEVMESVGRMVDRATAQRVVIAAMTLDVSRENGTGGHDTAHGRRRKQMAFGRIGVWEAVSKAVDDGRAVSTAADERVLKVSE